MNFSENEIQLNLKSSLKYSTPARTCFISPWLMAGGAVVADEDF
jgi:hypothetical protein